MESRPPGRKRCLYVATFDPTVSSTGTTTRGRLFLRYLSRRYETHVVHLEEKRPEGRDRALVASLAGIESVPYSAGRYFLFSFALLRAADRAIREHGCDFVFADFEKAGLYARLLRVRHGVPYVYGTHDVEYRRYLDVAPMNRLRYLFVPYMYLVERIASRGAALTVAISEPDAEVFRRWTDRENVLVLPCAFDENAINPFHEEPAEPRPVVLMVGHYGNAGNRRAAFAVVERMLPAVVARRPDAVFRFVGAAFPPELRRANVEAPGFAEDLMREYADASVIIAPIEIGGGIKIKVVEALASGKHLLSTAKGMEGIDYSGLANVEVVPIEQFADRIVEALNEPRAKTDAGWPFVASRFGTQRALETLGRRIDEAAGPRPRGSGHPSEARR